MFRTTACALLTALATLTATTELSSQVVRKTTTKHTSLVYCIYWQYCFELDNSAGTNFVGSFEVDYKSGTADVDSITTPNGWTSTIVPATATSPAKIRFTAGLGSRLAAGETLAGFYVETNCWPNVVEAKQDYRVYVPGGGGGLPSGSGLCSLAPGASSNFLYGDELAIPGLPMRIAATDEQAVGNAAFVLIGFPLETPIHLPGLGDLYIDPAFIVPLAPIPLDASGHGEFHLPIPPDPMLAGTTLMLQSATIQAGGAQLSNDRPLTIR